MLDKVVKMRYNSKIMNKPTKIYIPITLEQLNQKLDEEAKRIVREKEGGVAKYVSKQAHLGKNSTLVFTKKDGTKVTMSFRLNENDNLMLAYEKRFMDR